MPNREVLIQDYEAAMAKEKELWQKVIGRGPLSPHFDQPLFEKWLGAVGRTTLASKALREGPSASGNSRRGRSFRQGP